MTTSSVFGKVDKGTRTAQCLGDENDTKLDLCEVRNIEWKFIHGHVVDQK